MRTIQNRFFKITAFIPFLIFLAAPVYSAPNVNSLQLADSLYDLGKFTQSYHIYESIFNEKHLASPAMLLKMAFIQEGIKNYTDALYYLNLYYYMTYNKRALRKMEEIAKKNHLKGFQVTDMEFFRNVLYRYYLQFILGLAAVTWLLISYVIHMKNKYHAIPPFSLTMIFFVLLLLLGVVNFNRFDHKGLLVGDYNYLMEGPSPGSKLIEVAGKGNRVKIIGHDGAWMKVKYDNRIVYVR